MSDAEATGSASAVETGDSNVARQLLPLVYEELRRLAARRMSHNASEHTLQPTALVHEAYARLLRPDVDRKWNGRNHFFAAAAEAMRHIVIENVRRRRSEKHGGKVTREDVELDRLSATPLEDSRLLALNEALTALASLDPQVARLVELRFFAGLTIEEASRAIGVSERTAKRHWTYARAWLRRELERNEFR